MLEKAGLKIIAQKRIKLSKEQAGIFYLVHKERPFYDELCSFMASEPSSSSSGRWGCYYVEWKVMGATNPVEAEEGTIEEFALSIGENSVHGSDGETTAAFEISYFFWFGNGWLIFLNYSFFPVIIFLITFVYNLCSLIISFLQGS